MAIVGDVTMAIVPTTVVLGPIHRWRHDFLIPIVAMVATHLVVDYLWPKSLYTDIMKHHNLKASLASINPPLPQEKKEDVT